MDDNIENNNEDEQQTEQERITAAAAAAAAAARMKRLELISVLQRFDEIPSQSRNKTDELVDNFLTELGDDVHEMLSSNHTDEGGDYHGLDSDKDTEAEVEAIIRFFPHALSRNARHGNVTWGCHVKAVPFIPFLVRLAIQLGLFEEQYRGGLLCEDMYADNVLIHLMRNYDPEHPDADDKYLQVLLELRGMGLLKKEDIQSYDLLHELCRDDHFSEKRFRFMVEWVPNALTQTNEYGWLPIHCTSEESTIRRLELVFEYGIRYFPKKKGISLLFKKNNGRTPFNNACFGEKQMIKMIEDTFIRCYSSSDDTPPLNVEEALLWAAINENIQLDCVYFLLRRQPDMLQKLLLSASMTLIAEPNKNIDDDDGDDGNDGVSHNNLLVTGTIKKRKRE
ncbi:hypothetical protein FRACYDRAFT_244039 [Fragilariopsis cylindrus CCMP1102]|uniref:Uncharacterized protein n=1 Tax=Fragilariopsis cylindrus CCMP1102 TaxID=635003 RepID=A0A1E7F3R0_9STRA|nr:hypothetical protein FRACYDRAFT_244039 [Fragilariopsis cylindrus CCMP1102]|eukprot:OEU12766.1 hypothetical protein FRACYDRAFT_244039 [Fragilariopsis cylindrus CCMP1102]